MHDELRAPLTDGITRPRQRSLATFSFIFLGIAHQSTLANDAALPELSGNADDCTLIVIVDDQRTDYTGCQATRTEFIADDGSHIQLFTDDAGNSVRIGTGAHKQPGNSVARRLGLLTQDAQPVTDTRDSQADVPNPHTEVLPPDDSEVIVSHQSGATKKNR